jgi:hypothetical protein
MQVQTHAKERSAPAWLWSGLVFVAVSWILNWGLSGTRTHLLFFPLWFGYALVVDGWTFWRTGTSILARGWRGFAATFLLSAPAWWLFELINRRLGNWEYLGKAHFSDLEYVILCTVSFSTVMPAIFGTAELVRSSRWIQGFARGPRVVPSARSDALVFAAGLAMLALMLVKPTWFYPFCWTSLVFLLEPTCRRLGCRGLLGDLARGDWRTWMSLWTAGLICGFFWELWNVRSDPKWIYHVPGVGFWHVFEMPLLGYLGYLPFAMELYLLGQLALPRSAQCD